MKFYQDTTTGLFFIGDDILPAGKYRMNFYENDTIVSLEDITTDKEPVINTIEITNLEKEDGGFYADKDELLPAIKDLFISGSGSETTIKLVIRDIYFVGTAAIEIVHEYAEEILLPTFGENITFLEYSTDNEVSWFDPVFPINVAIGDSTWWRVKTYVAGKNSGSVVMNSNLV